MKSLGSTYLGDEPLGSHTVRPHQLGCVSIAAQCSRKGAGAVAGQHVQQRLRQEAAQEGALPDRAARARGGGSLEMLCKVRDLRRHTLKALPCLDDLVGVCRTALSTVVHFLYMQSEYVNM